MADICDIPLWDIKKGTTVRVRYYESGTGSLRMATGEFKAFTGSELFIEQRGISNAPNEFVGWCIKEREVDNVLVF